MKNNRTAAIASVALSAMLVLSGCAAGTTSADPKADAGKTTAADAPSPAQSTSDIQAAVDTFVTALDSLGIKHSDPVRGDVGMSGAKARFDITVDGFDAGINVFPDAKMLAAWGKASDAFGGIYVASGNAVLTLNSSEGVADSAAIAPKIAAAVGGTAHGV